MNQKIDAPPPNSAGITGGPFIKLLREACEPKFYIKTKWKISSTFTHIPIDAEMPTGRSFHKDDWLTKNINHIV